MVRVLKVRSGVQHMQYECTQRFRFFSSNIYAPPERGQSCSAAAQQVLHCRMAQSWQRNAPNACDTDASALSLALSAFVASFGYNSCDAHSPQVSH